MQKYDPDEASYARSASGATGTWAVKAGHAMMLKGGVIMGACVSASEHVTACARRALARACAPSHPPSAVRPLSLPLPLSTPPSRAAPAAPANPARRARAQT